MSAPRKESEQSDDWRQSGNRQEGQRENLTGGNQQSGGQGQRQGARDDDDLLDEEQSVQRESRSTPGQPRKPR